MPVWGREPSRDPSGKPGREPRGNPGREPSGKPGREPSGKPTREPSGNPDTQFGKTVYTPRFGLKFSYGTDSGGGGKTVAKSVYTPVLQGRVQGCGHLWAAWVRAWEMYIKQSVEN